MNLGPPHVSYVFRGDDQHLHWVARISRFWQVQDAGCVKIGFKMISTRLDILLNYVKLFVWGMHGSSRFQNEEV